jgi:hypothetical protein
MSLLAEIQAKCPPELIAAKEHGQIAALVSAGRTRPSTREIGNGTILETIGLTHGNAMLDVIYTDPAFRHVKPLLEQGRLIIGSPLVVQTIHGMVAGGVIPSAAGNALLSLTTEPAPVSVQEVIKAMEGM